MYPWHAAVRFKRDEREGVKACPPLDPHRTRFYPSGQLPSWPHKSLLLCKSVMDGQEKAMGVSKAIS